MHHGYEPSRIDHLRRQSLWAVGELDGIHSTDPAAATAMKAVAGLKSVIATGIIPAATTVGLVDPLGGTTPNFFSTPWDAVSGLWNWLVDTGRYSEMTDDELFDELLRLQLEGLPVDEYFRPDMKDPFWSDFEPLAQELALRAGADESFAERFAQSASELVLIPLAIDVADFDPAVVANMLVDVFEQPQWHPNIENNFRAYGAELLLEFLTGHPDVALDILADPVDGRGNVVDLLDQMLRWPMLDQTVVAAYLDAAMAAPFAPPQQDGLLLAAGKVLQDLVAIANGDSFPKGFRSEMSPILAKIVVQYLPFFVTSIEGGANVFFKDFELEDLGIKLGSHEEIVDLFGVLMRDPVSNIVLQQAILALSVLSAEQGGPLDITMDDLANYSLLLRQAAENEQLEEALETAGNRRIADLAIDLTFAAIDLITTVLAPVKAAGVDVPLDLIESGVRAFAHWAISESELGLDDVATITMLLMIIALAGGVIRSHDDEDDEATLEKVERADEIMQAIEKDLASGESLDAIEGRVRDLGRVVSDIDGEVRVLLGDPRVATPEYDVRTEADTEG